MTNSKLFCILSVPLAVMALVGCEDSKTSGNHDQMAAIAPVEEVMTDLSGAETPVQQSRTIDWTAARQAKIKAIEAGMNSDLVLSQASGNASLSPVPVMLPSGVVMPANAKQTLAFTEDGYFASYPGAKYDIIVNGTNEVFDTTARNADEAERAEMIFNSMDAGAQVSFSRFGADYLVEFECNILDGETSCISEEEALQVVNGLFVAVAE